MMYVMHNLSVAVIASFLSLILSVFWYFLYIFFIFRDIILLSRVCVCYHRHHPHHLLLFIDFWLCVE